MHLCNGAVRLSHCAIRACGVMKYIGIAPCLILDFAVKRENFPILATMPAAIKVIIDSAPKCPVVRTLQPVTVKVCGKPAFKKYDEIALRDRVVHRLGISLDEQT